MVLTPQDLNNKILLDKDDLRRTAWHVASEKSDLEWLDKLLEWSKWSKPQGI